MVEHKNLAEALAAFQAECPTLPKDATNPHFRSKFTPLDTIVERVSPLLTKHGLSWSAFPCFGPDGSPALRYALRHTSGDVESDVMPLLVTKNDPQGMGSALTYARRYALSSVLNLVSDDDDDGNGSSRPQAQRQQQRPAVDFRSAAAGLKLGQIREAFVSCGIQPPGGEVPAWQFFDNVPSDKAAVLAEALRSAER